MLVVNYMSYVTMLVVNYNYELYSHVSFKLNLMQCKTAIHEYTFLF